MANLNQAQIDAHKILDKFANELKKIKNSEKKDLTSTENGVRDEREILVCDEQFRKIMFKNAPKSDEECLILEKGNWN